jgi:integrase
MFYGLRMSEQKTHHSWVKTSVQNLVKHWRGGYYARLYVGGKERWKSLRTKAFEVAKARLREEQRNFGALEPVAKPSKAGRMTVGMAIEQLLAEAKAHVPMRRKGRKTSITESSAHYRAQTVDNLRKSWAETIQTELDPVEIRKVSAGEVRRWADVVRAKASATRFNNTLGTFRRLFDIGIAAGELHRNPAQDIARSYKQPKATYTPTREEFTKLVEAIRKSPSRLADDIADFVEFLAFTGARKEEAAHVLWSDFDPARERITFRKTKNGLVRSNELIPEAVALIGTIKAKRDDAPREERIFRVSEAYGALRSAAATIGIPRISHHDLRDLFATTAIESGVDIPTVADWLGHQDGGALLLERYRKHRDEHAKQAVKRVSFRGVDGS